MLPCSHSHDSIPTQSIQNNLERSEFETKTRLGTQIRGLEREVAVLKQRLSSEEERRGKMMDAYEMQVGRERERERERDREREKG